MPSPTKCTQFRGHHTPRAHTSPVCRDNSVRSVPATRSCVGSDAGMDTAREELAAQLEI